MNVLVLISLDSEQRARLEAAAPDARFVYAREDSLANNDLSTAEIIIGNIEPERLSDARCLRLLQLGSAGYDRYIETSQLREDTLIATAVGAYGQAVSEHALAMVLSQMKRLPQYRDDQRMHEWVDEGPVATMRGARALVLGTGDIGSHFARLVRALGGRATGIRRHTAAETPDGFESVFTQDALFAQLGSADVVASFLPSSKATRRLADATFFAAMKPGALFANAGRGDLVANDDLIRALESAHLGGAALDVTDPEPLPSDHRLWNAPNILITPHVAGGFHLPLVMDGVVDIAAENICRLEHGEPIRNVVSR
ncbi:D-isomer specific 2-hydroxyacid dehydrogenase NAD-binding protein [Coriobacterium glomerans PW2]|uniref:D-isomer specific 2-hydroxyacid dehydrogenase NAD-binding protein n=1 Tax=Coriobacterium glomerans (strain ATCC 49209 / DSM 20642 / JCM 10262 / PW2) TaxID=700015 RepID=F2NAI1_CORGP|nr:D-2-hydroxyacid dehydrogenase [Coriobacterium glomerans]AEB06508.1 D-isomer specific 2-hydroxyacid dehydrogenase NAD-binding protein [Coriobacterium glomerans PW2]